MKSDRKIEFVLFVAFLLAACGKEAGLGTSNYVGDWLLVSSSNSSAVEVFTFEPAGYFLYTPSGIEVDRGQLQEIQGTLRLQGPAQTRAYAYSFPQGLLSLRDDVASVTKVYRRLSRAERDDLFRGNSR